MLVNYIIVQCSLLLPTVFFCMRCGGWCTEKPVILARACVGNASAAGRLALRKLEKRLLPGRVWPNGH